MKNKSINKEQKTEIFKDIKTQSDKILHFSLWAFFLFGIFLSVFYDTYFIALSVGSLCLAAVYISYFLLPRSHLYQYVASGVLAIFAAQFIYQMHGLFEMHFFVFVGSTLLITYQNWRLQLPLIVLVVIHHAAFAYLQNSGVSGIYFTQLASMDLQAFLFHAFLAGLISFICAYWGYNLEKNTLSLGLANMELAKSAVLAQQNIALAEKISTGDYEVMLRAEVSENDSMGKALLQMRTNLLEAHQKGTQERWMMQGEAILSELMRSNIDNLNLLTQKVLLNLVQYINAQIGSVFIINEEASVENSIVLDLKAVYAYDRQKFLKKQLRIDDEMATDLVSQAFLGRKMIQLNQVPEDYIQINSGLGSTAPTHILIIPLIFNEKVYGVLETASFYPLENYKIVFLEKIATTFASYLATISTNEVTKQLLRQAQKQTEELRSQEEEMRQNLEELQTTQEDILRKDTELKGVFTAINVALATIEYDMQGYILTANDWFLKTIGMNWGKSSESPTASL
jgi:methyl-accepting chemotaxis protein